MKTITLFKGTPQQLVLGPLLAATIRDNKEAINLAETAQLPPSEMLPLVSRLAAACARRVDPAITDDQVDNIVDMSNFGEVFMAVFGASIPKPAPGESTEAGSVPG